jgi:hypothetical protein
MNQGVQAGIFQNLKSPKQTHHLRKVLPFVFLLRRRTLPGSDFLGCSLFRESFWTSVSSQLRGGRVKEAKASWQHQEFYIPGPSLSYASYSSEKTVI